MPLPLLKQDLSGASSAGETKLTCLTSAMAMILRQSFTLEDAQNSRENITLSSKAYEQFNKQSTEIRDYVYKLVRMQLDAPLTEEQSNLFTKLKSLQAELPATAKNLQKEKDEIETALQAAGLARVIGPGTVYVNVLLDINGVKKLVQSALKEAMFTEKNGKIEEQPAPYS